MTDENSTGNGDGENLLAGKYKTEEELHKGVINKIAQDYGGVESFYKAAEKGQVKINEDTTAPPQGAPQSGLAIEKEPVSLDEAKNEIMQNGKVSDNTYSELSKNMPKEALDYALQGIQSTKSAGETAVYEMVGGKEKYAELTAWAKENLSAEDIKGFNDAVTSGNQYLQKAALQSLQASYQSKEGTGGTRISGDLGGNPKTTEGFASQREMVTAMKDPKYQTDPAYREEVQQKVAKSNF